MYASTNFGLVASSVAQLAGIVVIPGSIHSGDNCARGAYIGCGNAGPVRSGCRESLPVLSEVRAPTRAAIVFSGSTLVSKPARAVVSAGVPPNGGASAGGARARFT